MSKAAREQKPTNPIRKLPFGVPYATPQNEKKGTLKQKPSNNHKFTYTKSFKDYDKRILEITC